MVRKKKEMKIDQEQLTNVMRASWDASYDYEIPLKRAKELYDEGKLDWDITNGCYCTPNPYPVTDLRHRSHIGPKVL